MHKVARKTRCALNVGWLGGYTGVELHSPRSIFSGPTTYRYRVSSFSLSFLLPSRLAPSTATAEAEKWCIVDDANNSRAAERTNLRSFVVFVLEYKSADSADSTLELGLSHHGDRFLGQLALVGKCS